MFNKIFCAICISLAASTCHATPISASTTGLLAPAVVVTFDEIAGLVTDTPITTQFASFGVTFKPNVFFTPDETVYSNMSGNRVGNFSLENYQPQFSINFLTTQTAAAFAFISTGATYSFEALLSNALVESFSANVGSGINDFFGFQGVSFDQIRITTLSENQEGALLDNLQLSKAATVTPPTPEPLPEPRSLLLLITGFLSLLLAKRHI